MSTVHRLSLALAASAIAPSMAAQAADAFPARPLEKLNHDIASVVRIPGVSARLNGMGCMPTTNTPQEFAAFVRSEMQKWGGLARKVNLQPN